MLRSHRCLIAKSLIVLGCVSLFGCKGGGDAEETSTATTEITAPDEPTSNAIGTQIEEAGKHASEAGKQAAEKVKQAALAAKLAVQESTKEATEAGTAHVTDAAKNVQEAAAAAKDTVVDKVSQAAETAKESVSSAADQAAEQAAKQAANQAAIQAADQAANPVANLVVDPVTNAASTPAIDARIPSLQPITRPTELTTQQEAAAAEETLLERAKRKAEALKQSVTRHNATAVSPTKDHAGSTGVRIPKEAQKRFYQTPAIVETTPPNVGIESDPVARAKAFEARQVRAEQAIQRGETALKNGEISQ